LIVKLRTYLYARYTCRI
jgi:hypothetical protein